MLRPIGWGVQTNSLHPPSPTHIHTHTQVIAKNKMLPKTVIDSLCFRLCNPLKTQKIPSQWVKFLKFPSFPSTFIYKLTPSPSTDKNQPTDVVLIHYFLSHYYKPLIFFRHFQFLCQLATA